ncbi:PRC-barrel domain-containing protein, partial [Cypionkella sp.]
VYDANDKAIGEVSNLVLAADGKATDVVIDVGGFLGMGEKPVALPLADVDILREAEGEDLRVYLSQTKEQLEAMPNFAG